MQRLSLCGGWRASSNRDALRQFDGLEAAFWEEALVAVLAPRDVGF